MSSTPTVAGNGALKTRILIVDDERASRDLCTLLLSHAGHAVFTAASSPDGIAWLERNPADLVITDALMRERTGLATMREIHRRWPRVPMVAFTCEGQSPAGQSLRLARAFGARAFLSKPFAARELYTAVATALAFEPLE